MRRILAILFFAIILIGISLAQNQIKPPMGAGDTKVKTSASTISFPSTYKFTQTFPGDDRCPEVTHYFIFQSPKSVVWCNESDDGYLYAIAVGQYIEKSKKILFSNDIVHSSYSTLQHENIEVSVKKKNGKIIISSNSRSLGFPMESYVLEKLKTSIKPSSALVGTTWKAEADNEDTFYLKFISDLEVELLYEGKTETHTYILIGDKIGILTGDNPTKEAIVGDLKNGVLKLHRSGFKKYMSYPWFEMHKVENTSAINPGMSYFDGYGYTDLGLPSGTLWATTNLGANNKWEAGFYLDSINDFRIWEEDPASIYRSNNWRTPSYDQFEELINFCTWNLTTQNGVIGYEVIGPNSNEIFIPIVGTLIGSEIENYNIYGYYWCSLPYDSDFQYFLSIDSLGEPVELSFTNKSNLFTIRPILLP